MIVDLFAGPGGWSEAVSALGYVEVGLEHEANACQTRRNAGHLTIRTDVSSYPTFPFEDLVTGLIASPPCHAFSEAGKGEGRQHLDDLVTAILANDWSARPSSNPEVWLSLDLGRWIDDLRPEWIAFEQVPAVLPLWEAFATSLDLDGYSTWSGILNAADFGVPQVRKRAFLIASRVSTAHPPAPTHTRHPADAATLFGQLEEWVTMADALGWVGEVGFPRVDDVGTSDDGFRERDWRPTSEPSFALTEKARSWTYRRPSTTIAGDPRVFHPGSHIANDGRNLDNAIGRSDHTTRVTIEEALVLQSFPPDYPVAGGKTRQFQQIGNAVPPRLAEHILRQIVT